MAAASAIKADGFSDAFQGAQGSAQSTTASEKHRAQNLRACVADLPPEGTRHLSECPPQVEDCLQAIQR